MLRNFFKRVKNCAYQNYANEKGLLHFDNRPFFYLCSCDYSQDEQLLKQTVGNTTAPSIFTDLFV